MQDLIQYHFEGMATGAANINTATSNIRADLDMLISASARARATWDSTSAGAFQMRVNSVNAHCDNIDAVCRQTGVHLVNASNNIQHLDTSMANQLMPT